MTKTSNETPDHRRIIPEWLEWVVWVAGVILLFKFSEPLFDWFLERPFWFVAAIGSMTYFGMLAVTYSDWRFGTKMIRQASARISDDQTEPETPMVGLWVILGLGFLVWIIVTVVAISVASPGTDGRAFLIIIPGGLTAGIAGLFLVYPTILIVGALRPRTNVGVAFLLRLDRGKPDALDVRMELDRMPAPNGLTRPKRVPGTATTIWRAAPVSLSSIILRQGSTLDVRRHADQATLELDARTDAGDKEMMTLVQRDDKTIEVSVDTFAASRWTRGVVAFAGEAGFARMISALESARMANMLGAEVEVLDLAAKDPRDDN